MTTVTLPTDVPAESAAPAYTEVELGLMADAAESFVRMTDEASLALHRFMRVVGESPTFDQWEAARKAAVSGYRRKYPAATDDAGYKFWSRFVSGLRQYAGEHGFEFTVPEKPKAATPEATKKAAQRAAEKKAVEAFGSSAEALKAAADVAASLAAGTATTEDVAKAMIAQKAAVALAESEKKAAAKAAESMLKERRKVLKAAVDAAPAHVLSILELAAVIAGEGSTEDQRSAAWGAFEAIAPKAKGEPAKARKAA